MEPHKNKQLSENKSFYTV